MRRKFLKIAAVFNAAFLAVGLCACNNATPDESSKNQSQSDRVMLYDFETQYERANVISRYAIGKTVLSDAHVTSGEKSLYLEIDGIFPEHEETHIYGTGYEEFMSDYIKLSTRSNKSFTVTDYSAFESISVDIFNDSGRDTHMGVYLQTQSNGSYSYYNSYFVPLGTRVLLSGKENRLDFELFNVRYRGIGNVEAVYFVFENREEGETPLKLYMDNFHGTKAKETSDTSLPVRSGLLLSGFESDCDAQMFDVSLYSMPVDAMPRMELSDENATQGERSLKITLPMTNLYCRCGAWGGFSILTVSGKQFFQGVDVNKLLRDSSSEASDFAVRADVYNPTGEWEVIEFGGVSFWIAPNDSATIEKPLSSYSFTQGYIETLTLAFTESRTSCERVFYLDNLRIEKK